MGLAADHLPGPATSSLPGSATGARRVALLLLSALGLIAIALPRLAPANTTFLQADLVASSSREALHASLRANGTAERSIDAGRVALSPEAPGGDAGSAGLLIPKRQQPSPSSSAAPLPPVPSPLPLLPDAPDSDARLYTPAGQSHLAASSLDAAGLAPLTQAFQASLWASQHPTDCSKRDYVVFGGWNGGLGSDVHVSGSFLLCAWAAGRVFVWSDIMGEQFTEDDKAPGAVAGGGPPKVVPPGFEAGNAPCPPGKLGFRCLFQSPSNCTMADARARTGDSNAMGSWTHQVCRSPDPKFAGEYIQGAFRAELAKLGITGESLKYWARAQSAAYIMRLSESSLTAVAAMRRAPGLFSDPSIPLPLPPGSVALHMRQGDKEKDMSLVPGSAYGNIALNTLQWMTPLSPASVIFTLTDGAAALADLVAWHSQQRAAGGRAASTALAYVPSTVLPRIDGGRNARVESVDGSRPTLWLTRMYLLQLLVALEADAWVGTRPSNWSRLLDELRCVWVAKCRLPFVEAGANPAGYDWRRRR